MYCTAGKLIKITFFLVPIICLNNEVTSEANKIIFRFPCDTV